MKNIILFDVDGTLTIPRNKVSSQMLDFLKSLHDKIDIGIVGGSDLSKIKEQLGENLLSYDYVDYVFSENGLVAHKNGELIHKNNIIQYMGNDKMKKFINYVLHYIADLYIPVKTGTFIELRSGMFNISPIGRNCSQEERDDFEKYDKIFNIRENMVDVLKDKFKNYNLNYAIGGQISFDVFPEGWDKTYSLQFLTEYDNIYFMGDKTNPGGNDYEIYESPLTKSYSVKNYHETIENCKKLFM
jgi:phosphomannomutase